MHVISFSKSNFSDFLTTFKETWRKILCNATMSLLMSVKFPHCIWVCPLLRGVGSWKCPSVTIFLSVRDVHWWWYCIKMGISLFSFKLYQWWICASEIVQQVCLFKYYQVGGLKNFLFIFRVTDGQHSVKLQTCMWHVWLKVIISQFLLIF